MTAPTMPRIAPSDFLSIIPSIRFGLITLL